MPDQVALDSYYAISSKLLDGYPSVYNDWDQLWSVIKKIGSAVLPTVRTALIASGLKPVAQVGEQVVGVVKAARRAFKRRNNQRGRGGSAPAAKASGTPPAVPSRANKPNLKTK